MMKTTTALHIAEVIWNESFANTKFFDIMVNFGYDFNNPNNEHNNQVLKDQGVNIREEVVSSWANLIMEHNHSEH